MGFSPNLATVKQGFFANVARVPPISAVYTRILAVEFAGLPRTPSLPSLILAASHFSPGPAPDPLIP